MRTRPKVDAPYVAFIAGKPYLVVLGGIAEYRIPADPVRAFGLLAHLAEKTWADREFFKEAIDLIARANNWSHR